MNMTWKNKLTYSMKNAMPILYRLLCGIVVFALSGCIHEPYGGEVSPDSYLYVQVSDMNTRSGGIDRDTPETEDYAVSTLRILAFEKNADRTLVNNQCYTLPADMLRFPIDAGTYDLVFLGNEPRTAAVAQALDGVTRFSDLDAIAFPQAAFAAGEYIPMMQTVANVEALGDGSAKVNGAAAVNPLTVSLNRLAVRLDVTLEAPLDLSPSFEELVLSNLPDVVPLMASYSGSMSRTTVRMVGASDFTGQTPSGSNTWAVRKARIILPASESADPADEGAGVELTVKMSDDKYSPSCKLKIFSASEGEGVLDNYTLPKNTYLEFRAKIASPLEVNIKASEWSQQNNDWIVPENRVLNVSHSRATITDFNGARISFWSNMPVVRVLPQLQQVNPANTDQVLGTYETNRIFNSIAYQSTEGGDYATTPARFNYSTTVRVNGTGQWSGAGYMDLMADGWLENIGGGVTGGRNVAGTYKLTLSAENADGSNALQREIIVTVSQNGERFQWYHPHAEAPYPGATGYVGAFWKNDQYGERIITGQHARTFDEATLAAWEARVGYDPHGMVILSSTPSFDPLAGTDAPNDAENYRVVPNAQKGEDGKSVQGKGRIYFRIGLTGANDNPVVNGLREPRYATVIVTYRLWGGDQTEATLYLRQGEHPDYLYEKNATTRPGARRFSVYNMTHQEFKSAPGTSDFSKKVTKSTAAEVDFPTKAGAHFQWARLGSYGATQGTPPLAAYDSYGYRAFNPRFDMNGPVSIEQWGSVVYSNEYLKWGNFSAAHEICPTGYHRPNDGNVGAPQRNNTAALALQSEMRASLFQSPMTGDGNYEHLGQGNYYKPGIIANGLTFGFYADGYFDRRPIQRDIPLGTYGVALTSADVAYWGCVFFNPATQKSIFFPSAGRRSDTYDDFGKIMYPTSGYYMTATAAYGPDGLGYTDYSQIWHMEMNYVQSAPISVKFEVGMSLRCVKDE